MNHRIVGRHPGASRRQVLATMGGALGASIGRQAFAGQRPHIDQAPFSTQDEIWRDVVYMNDLGPRYAGNAAHAKFTGFLDNSLDKSGLILEPIKHSSLVLWDHVRSEIKTASGAQIPVSSFCRWAATTGPEGVTAPLKFCGRATGPSFFNALGGPDYRPSMPIPADVAGKIALVEITVTPLQFKAMYDGHAVTVDPLHAGAMPDVQTTSPAWSAAMLPRSYKEDLRAAGAVGVIFAWVNLADDDALGQQKDGSPAIPSVWVGPTAGRDLRALAERGESITLTVQANIVKDVPTHTTVATLPGERSDEVIVLWTHTDGNNAIEENGGVAMAHMMKYFSSLPKSARRRTITCVFSEGHFAEQYLPTTAWLQERPDLIKNAVASVSIEHLGCQEWVDDPATNTFRPTGKPDLVFVNCPTPPMHQVMMDSLDNARLTRTVVLDTAERGLPGPGLHAWRIGKIPIIASIAVPPYLMAEGRNGHIDKLKPDQFHEETLRFADIVRRLDAVPKNVLKPG